MKKIRKISSIILSVLMLVTLIGFNKQKVIADSGGTGSITAYGLFEQIFDLDGLMWHTFDRGHEIQVTDQYGTHAAWCIEASDPIPESSDYYNAHHNGFADYTGARDVLLNWYDAATDEYAGYRYNNISYYAVQLAVWGKLGGGRPGDVLRSRILPGYEELANTVLNIADDLYDRSGYPNQPEIIYTDYKTKVEVPNNINLQNLPTAIKTADGRYYWRSPQIVVKSGGNAMYNKLTNLQFDISISNFTTESHLTANDVVITDSGNFDQTHFEAGVRNGNSFYIWVPMFTDAGVVTAPGSFDVNVKVKYRYIDTLVYDPANPEYQSIMTLTENEGEDTKVFHMSWNGFEEPETPTVGRVITKKVGRYYSQRTTENFIASNGQSYEYFNIPLADNIGLPGIDFALKYKDGTAVNNGRYTTYLDGSLIIDNIELDDTKTNEFYLVEDTPEYATATNITSTTGEPMTWVDESGISYPIVKYWVFNPESGDGWNVKDFSGDSSKWIQNGTKTVTITAVKKDNETGQTVQGAVFGVYNTQPIVVADAASPTGFSTIQPGSRIAVGETDASGSVYLGEFIDDQTYIVEELAAPAGYELNSDVVVKNSSVTGDPTEANRQNTQSGSYDMTPGTDKDEYTFTFKNDVTVAEYALKKVDGETGEALPGAGFQIYSEDGSEAITYVVTGADGIAKFILPTGKYLVKETAVPEGYEMDHELVDGVVITVSADSDVVNMTVIKNNKIKLDPITVTQKITKVVTGDTPDAPTNFRFKIGNPDGEFERNIYGAGEVLVTHTFDKAGLYSFTISEVNGGINGYTYDDSSYDVIFEVTADYENKVLVAGEPQIFKDGNPWTEGIVFTNNYKKPEKIEEPVKVDLTFYKKISGNPKEKETFTFDITEQKEGGQTTSQAIKGSGSITITLEGDEVGSEIYTISERNLTSTQIAKGWKKDNSIYTVTFTVSDIDGDGVYEGKVDVKKDGEKVDRIEFTNTYSTSLTCRSGYHLEDEKCVKDSDGCEEGYHYDKDKKTCVKDETSCKEGYTLRDGVCVEEKTDDKTSPKTGIDFNYMHSYYKGRN